VPVGVSPSDFESRAEVLAAGLGAREVRVKRRKETAGIVDLVIVGRDPLLDPAPLEWPNRDEERLSLWRPVPVAVDEDGEFVMVSLAERNLLLGGEPGAGKSVALSLLVATAALDPSVELYLLDGKLVELACWEPVAKGFAGPKIGEAVELLTRLQEEMDRRYQVLRAARRRKVERASNLPLCLVVCDELAHYLTVSDRKGRGEFADLLRDLVSRGRAAGVIVLAATQKPSGDIVPTALRDLFSFRWALRCSTWQASDTVLGAGWSALGYSASSIPPEGRGVGFLLHEGGIPRRCKAFHLSDDELHAIAERAEAKRRQAGKLA
jgi:DNA segregation ATPase FtsK/SpoIIIE-like protein